MASVKYWVWLASQERLTSAEKTAVLSAYGDPEAAFFSPNRVEGLRESSAEALERRDLRESNRILDACDEQGLRVICLQDTAYPLRLKQIAAPPAVLYAKGRLRDLDEEAAIAVIGTRKPSGYGLRMARELASGIVRCGGAVLSGLGQGIDGEAAKAALESNGYCVGVLGTPHDQAAGWLCREVAGWGLLLSEYAPGTEPQRHFFRERNRVTAGLSVGVVVVEAPEKSGALLFANEANDQGREIFAVPGEVGAPNSVGTIALIQEGAFPAACAWDIMREFTGRFPEKLRRSDAPSPPKPFVRQELERTAEPEREQPPAEKAAPEERTDWKEQLSRLNAEQLMIISAIEKDATHIDDIVEATGLGAAKVLSQLTILEIKGFIRREAGRRIALKITKK